MKITILAYLEPDAKEPDIVMTQVAEALEKAGHQADVMTIREDVSELVAGLRNASRS